MMNRVASVTPGPAGAVSFALGLGAFQGSEGEGTGEDWFLENSFFELDAPNEFFFNFSTRQLFYFHNATAGTPPPAEWTWEVPALDVLVSLAGASDVTISGLTFTSASPTYLAPHDLPSGGDWGLSRLGAVRLEDTQRVTITDCAFTRLDGNAVFVNGRNVNATVTRSSFSWLGESAVALFGYSDGPDVTALNIPLGTSMTDCLCRHIGITEKQVSCFAQNVAARSVVTGNVFWQMPRAAVNYNVRVSRALYLIRDP